MRRLGEVFPHLGITLDLNLHIERGGFKIKECCIPQNHQKISETNDIPVDTDLENTELIVKSQRVLGVEWDLKSDMLQFKLWLFHKKKERKNRA